MADYNRCGPTCELTDCAERNCEWMVQWRDQDSVPRRRDFGPDNPCGPACLICNPVESPQMPDNDMYALSATPVAQEPQSSILGDPGKPEGPVVNPKELAGSLKAPIWQVLPRWVVLLVGRVMQVGAAKYGAFNYRESNVWAMTYVDAIERHMQLWQDGEDDDPETGVSHLAHVIAGCAILLDTQANGRLGDDRQKTGLVRRAMQQLDDLRERLPLPAPQF